MRLRSARSKFAPLADKLRLMHPLDMAVIGVYFLVVVALGLYSGREEKDENDYFLGGRSMPWLAVALSLYATTASALTFIGVPGAAFAGDFVYLQLAVGDLLGRFGIGYFLLPAYFRYDVTTVYQLLGKRFGDRSQDLGTLLFLGTRLLASGVRLAACSVAFSVIFQVPLSVSIPAITLVALVYTFSGGIKAVIWTDTLQFCLFVGGALVSLWMIWSALPDGFQTFLELGQKHGKFQIFHFSWDLNDSTNFIPGTLFGMLLTFSVQGTDQDMVQRMLTTKTCQESQRALFLTALMNIPMTLLFLSVGASLFAYYQVFPDPQVVQFVEGTPKHTDYVFPHFMATVLGPGVRGFLVAGLLAAAMSSLDSALSALSSTAYVDLYKKYVEPEAGSARALQVSRRFSILFALILAGVATGFAQIDGILWVGFQVMGLTYGTLLGIFLVGIWTTRRGSDLGNAIAMVTSIALVIFLTNGTPYGLKAFGRDPLAWPWSIVIGTVWTFGVGCLFSTPEKVVAQLEKEGLA